ncbi:MAG: hypothetical protein Tsb005_14530 [Gammaproteobacteria bacterium]
MKKRDQTIALVTVNANLPPQNQLPINSNNNNDNNNNGNILENDAEIMPRKSWRKFLQEEWHHFSLRRYLHQGYVLKNFLLRLARNKPGMAKLIDGFFDGIQVTNIYWPIALTAIMLRDLIIYSTQPDARFSTRVGDLVSGIAPEYNPAFTSFVIAHDAYYAAVLLGAPVVLGMLHAFPSPFRIRRILLQLLVETANTHTVDNINTEVATLINDITKELQRDKKQFSLAINYFIRIHRQWQHSAIEQAHQQRLWKWITLCVSKRTSGAILHYYSNYQLWVQHVKVPKVYLENEQPLLNSHSELIYFSPKSRFLTATFWMGWLASWYFSYRYWQIIASIIAAKISFEINRSHCDAQWAFMQHTGAYECVVCDWDEVFYPQRFNPQDCVNGLLSVARSPQLLAERLAQLPAKVLTDIDLSQQTWSDWPQETAIQVFNEWLRLASTTSLNRVNLSQATPLTQPLNDWQVALLSELLRLPIRQIDLQGIHLMPEDAITLLSLLVKDTLHYLNLSSMNLTDATFTTLQDINNQTISWPQLKFLSLAHNPLTAASIVMLPQFINSTHFEEADLSGINCTQTCIDIIAADYPPLEKLHLSEWILTTANLSTLGAYINQNTQFLNLVSCELTDISINTLFATLNQSQLTLDLSHNAHLTKQMMLNLPQHLYALSLAGIYLAGSGGVFRQWLQQATLTTLDVTNAALENDDWAAFCDVLPAHLQRLSLVGNRITDISMQYCAHHIAKYPLTYLNVNQNALHNEGIIALFMALQNSTQSLEQLFIAQTQCDDKVMSHVLSWVASNQHLRSLDMSYNQLGARLSELFRLLPSIPLTNIVIRGNSLAEQDATTLATSLVAPISSLQQRQIGAVHIPNLLSAQIATLTPATAIHTMDLADCGIGPHGMVALCRVLPNIADDLTTMKLANNDNRWIDSNSCEISSAASAMTEPSALYALLMMYVLYQTVLAGLAAIYQKKQSWWQQPLSLFHPSNPNGQTNEKFYTCFTVAPRGIL